MEKTATGKMGNGKLGNRKIRQIFRLPNFPVAQFPLPLFSVALFSVALFTVAGFFLPRIHLAVTSDIGNYRLRSSVLHGAVDTVALSPSVYLSVRSPDRYFSALYWAQTLKTLAVDSPDYRASK